MISVSEAYRAAIVASPRRMLPLAILDIISPDIVYAAAGGSAETAASRSAQLHDKGFSLGTPMATLERNRWLLDGGFAVAGTLDAEEQVGYESAGLFGEDGAGELWAELRFSGVSILQMCAVYFPGSDYDGYPEDFTVEVRQGGVAYHTRTFTGNRARAVFLKGFTVYDPDAVRVTVTKWNHPLRRLRLPEIVPGAYEEWDGDIIAALSVTQQGSFSGLSLPYGTCRLSMDNRDRRFEPRSKTGIFSSIEERQGIDVQLGPETDGGAEYVRAGVFYQYSGGWKTGDNGLSMSWDLVDIIGLLLDREFLPPDTLPETLEGWVAALAAQLGVNFAGRYTVDADYAALPCTAARAGVEKKKCGQILLWICQATETWARADAETGYLAVEPFWSEGGTLDLDNLAAYPVMRANDDLARIDFTLSDGTEFSVAGTSAASPNTASVQNPFLHTQAAALAAARMILAAYGGNRIETTGRGDPSGEIGDVVTVQLDESSATTGRLMQQTLQFQDGVLQGCKSVLLQATGWQLYRNRVLLTESGVWTAPAGVSSLYLVVGQGGRGGMPGSAGSWSADGKAGTAGSGGKIWYGTVNINEGQSFATVIGAGGAASAAYGTEGAEGAHTAFGAYSSANGRVYETGFTDVRGGDSFGRSAVAAPLANTSDGGAGGAAGVRGITHTSSYTGSDGKSYSRTVIDRYPGPGGAGVAGASGFVLIYFDQP